MKGLTLPSPSPTLKMMEKSRWKQRFDHFEQAFDRLKEALNRVQGNPNDDLLVAGLIQTYEFTLELGWKTMKDFLYEKGFDLHGSKETMKQAFQEGFVQDGHGWMQAIEDRNMTARTYNQTLAKEVLSKIKSDYFPLLSDLYFFLKHALNS